MPRRLAIKELAAAIGRSRWYIWAAMGAGFVMPQRRATAEEWREWEDSNPNFCARRHLAARRQHPPTSANT